MNREEVAMFNMADYKFDAIKALVNVNEPQSIALITEKCLAHGSCPSPHVKAISGSRFLLYKMIKEAAEDIRQSIVEGGDTNEKLALEIYEQEEKQE